MEDNMKLLYENKKLLIVEGVKKVVTAEWNEDLKDEEINVLKAGFSPLFFKRGLIRYNHINDKAFFIWFVT